jgi:hypothetical protein
MDLPDATVLVLQGFVFIAILMSEALYGRLKIFNPEKCGGRDGRRSRLWGSSSPSSAARSASRRPSSS